MASSQELLGDPAGNGNAEYWDKWFSTVSQGNKFEWYCQTKDIVKVLSDSLASSSTSDDVDIDPSTHILHGGTGNSELIFDLSSTHSVSQATAIDISPVAIAEMKEKQSSRTDNISFILQDVLSLPLPFDADSFDAYVDKGLMDAMMDSHTSSTCQTNTKTLFAGSWRVLKNRAPYVCISLGEEHIAHLLLSVLLGGADDPEIRWGPLHIYPLSPSSSSSTLRPFAFVLLCDKDDIADSSSRRVVHFHHAADEATISNDYELTTTELKDPDFESVNALLCSSRTSYSEYMEKKAYAEAASSGGGDDDRRLALAKLEIKPYEAETDLNTILENLKAPDSQISLSFPTIQWKAHETVEIGFGISKLVVTIIVAYEDLDELVEMIQEVEEDSVQSVDVNYDETQPLK
jgi:translation elongation factor EF-1beta/SAM-dependent methyltransferase